MHHNLEMPYSFYSGPRNGDASHIKAILEWQECLRDDERIGREREEEDRQYYEEREEEEARAYLRQKPIMLTDDKED